MKSKNVYIVCINIDTCFTVIECTTIKKIQTLKIMYNFNCTNTEMMPQRLDEAAHRYYGQYRFST